MQLSRRHILIQGAALLAAAPLARAQGLIDVPSADPRMAPQVLGSPTAKIEVDEWFSFTCPHCATFSKEVFPEIKAKLIDTGKIRYIFNEYPRDQTDLMAAMVARSLPRDRYLPFVEELFATQMQWAYSSNDPKEELAKQAALAGMPRAMFDKVVSDDKLRAEILNAQMQIEKSYNIDSTPSFIVNGALHAGEVDYATFAGWVGA